VSAVRSADPIVNEIWTDGSMYAEQTYGPMCSGNRYIIPIFIIPTCRRNDVCMNDIRTYVRYGDIRFSIAPILDGRFQIEKLDSQWREF
jgi:hypothetical protein